MDRVTDEWLLEADNQSADQADEKYPHEEDFQEWAAASRSTFAQAIALECVRLVNDEINACNAAVSITTTTEQARQNQNNILTRIDALRWAAAQIRARFGLEESKENQK